MSYSFDDNWIGKISQNSQFLSTREIPRPRGIEKRDWYEYAGLVVLVLNRQSAKDAEIERLHAEVSVLLGGLQAIRAHQRIVAGARAEQSTVYLIADEAIRKAAIDTKEEE